LDCQSIAVATSSHVWTNGICSNCGYVCAHTTFNNDCTCTKCGMAIHMKNTYCRHDNVIYFGSYPQTRVTDSTLVSNLSSKAGTLPSSSYTGNWTSYKYYINGSNTTDYMWYIDVTYGGYKYRGVYFTSYRPYYCTESTKASNSYQDDNGYTLSTVYWFRYDAIKWNILDETNGNVMVWADLGLDAQQYDYDGAYSNNYGESTIRAWLNETFYATAFSAAQQEMIVATSVDNSARSTNPTNNATYFNNGENTFACDNTNDKVWLLSVQEVTNVDYNFASSTTTYNTVRRKQSTDYAKAQGAYVQRDGTEAYVGNGWATLRSPFYDRSDSIRNIRVEGYAEDWSYAYNSALIIVPAIKIRLSETDYEETETKEVYTIGKVSLNNFSSPVNASGTYTITFTLTGDALVACKLL